MRVVLSSKIMRLASLKSRMHPGNYIYYDTMQQALGSCTESRTGLAGGSMF